MKVKRNNKKIIILPGITILIIGIILSLELHSKVVEVEAAQTVFNEVNSSYINKGELKVLEIVPTENDAELGYFIPYDSNNTNYGGSNPLWTVHKQNDWAGHQSVSSVTYGTRYGEDTTDTNTNVHRALLTNLRKYGMIKNLGLDTAIDGLGEYPLRTLKAATFAEGTGQSGGAEYAVLGNDTKNFISGHYIASSNTNYKLKDNYILYLTGAAVSENDINHKFLVTDSSPNKVKSVDSLDEKYFYAISTHTISENDANQICISDNGIPATVYRQITNNTGLPEAVDYVGDGNGDLQFSYQAGKPDIYQGYSTASISYLTTMQKECGPWICGNWFDEYILGTANSNTTVVYNMKIANTVTADDIVNYDLIYISGKSQQYNATNNLKDEVVQAIYNKTTNEYKAIMMDKSCYSGNKVPKNNIDRVAMLTWQQDQKCPQKMNEYKDYFDDKSNLKDSELTNALNNKNLFKFLYSTMEQGYDGNFAINNVFVYNHHWEDFQLSLLRYEQVDALDNFANGDFKSPYISAAVAEGFQSVLSYIKINNNNTSIGHMAEGYVTPAIAIQYILSYRGEDLGAVKNQYSVLEIQPTKEFLYNQYNESIDYSISPKYIQDNRNNFIMNVLGGEIVTANNQDFITFTSMTVDEFNTRQDDLLPNYDIVYIGDECAKYYETYVGKSINVSNFTVSNNKVYPIHGNTNSTMAGLIYYNQGRYCSSKTDVKDRYSSRDLTEPKLAELKDYLQNNGLIICGEDLMSSKGKGNLIINPTGISENGIDCDHGRLDTSSNMYELFKYAQGSFPNLVSEHDLLEGYITKLDISSYLGKAKLEITMLEEPPAYSYIENAEGVIDKTSYLQRDKVDNKYYLRYQFAIENSEIEGIVGQTYKVHFYQDINSDGRFGDTEEISDIKIYSVVKGTEVSKVTLEDGNTEYNLSGGTAYELERQVPQDEGGIINWCIKVEKATDSKIYATKKGYVAIQPSIKKNINLLQITANDNNNLELENAPKEFEKYLNMSVVADQYNITIKTITVEQFEKDLGQFLATVSTDKSRTVDAKRLNYFATFQRTEEDIFSKEEILKDENSMNINMITLGYADLMSDLNQEASYALKAFIEAGKPVLFSNNCIQGVSSNSVTKLASATGMDRYGYYNPLYKDYKDKNTISSVSDKFYDKYAKFREDKNLAITYLPNSARKTLSEFKPGYTNTILKQNENSYPFIMTDAVLKYGKDSVLSSEYMYVDKMNDGQICNFPYKISDHVLIRKSHAQEFQLDLDSDVDKNNKSDAIVWFTLSAMAGTDINKVSSYSTAIKADSAKSQNIYSATPGDGINNYYVYNYGNVTYSGIGANKQFTNLEVQLYVNTLLAAYEAGFTNPSVTYYKASDVDEGELNSFAVAYDANVTLNEDVDSSIQYDEKANEYMYKFVNPNTDSSTVKDGTKAFFKINDSNFVKDEKVATTAFYLEVDGVKGDTYILKDGDKEFKYEIEEILLEDNTAITVVRIPINVYENDFSKIVGSSSSNNNLKNPNPELEVGKVYGFYAPMSYLETKGAANIYIQANTGYKGLDDNGNSVIKPLGTAFDMFSMMKQDLLKLD